MPNSPGCGLGIRQWTGWEQVRGTEGSGIWVLKDDSRDLDHFSVSWTQWRTNDTPGHDCLFSCKYGQGVAIRPQTHPSVWVGVNSLWSRVAPLFCPWCA